MVIGASLLSDLADRDKRHEIVNRTLALDVCLGLMMPSDLSQGTDQDIRYARPNISSQTTNSYKSYRAVLRFAAD